MTGKRRPVQPAGLQEFEEAGGPGAGPAAFSSAQPLCGCGSIHGRTLRKNGPFTIF